MLNTKPMHLSVAINDCSNVLAALNKLQQDIRGHTAPEDPETATETQVAPPQSLVVVLDEGPAILDTFYSAALKAIEEIRELLFNPVNLVTLAPGPEAGTNVPIVDNNGGGVSYFPNTPNTWK